MKDKLKELITRVVINNKISRKTIDDIKRINGIDENVIKMFDSDEILFNFMVVYELNGIESKTNNI